MEKLGWIFERRCIMMVVAGEEIGCVCYIKNLEEKSGNGWKFSSLQIKSQG